MLVNLNKCCGPECRNPTLSVSLVLAVGDNIAPKVAINGGVLYLTAQLKNNSRLNPVDSFHKIAAACPSGETEFSDDKALNLVSEVGGSLACANYSGALCVFCGCF